MENYSKRYQVINSIAKIVNHPYYFPTTLILLIIVILLSLPNFYDKCFQYSFPPTKTELDNRSMIISDDLSDLVNELISDINKLSGYRGLIEFLDSYTYYGEQIGGKIEDINFFESNSEMAEKCGLIIFDPRQIDIGPIIGADISNQQFFAGYSLVNRNIYINEMLFIINRRFAKAILGHELIHASRFFTKFIVPPQEIDQFEEFRVNEEFVAHLFKLDLINFETHGGFKRVIDHINTKYPQRFGERLMWPFIRNELNAVAGPILVREEITDRDFIYHFALRYYRGLGEAKEAREYLAAVLRGDFFY